MPRQKDAPQEPILNSVVTPAPERLTLSPTQICRELERTLPREQEDRVKCAHLFGSYYRCNWWSRVVVSRIAADYDWSALLTDHVRRSGFLKVTADGDKLTVEELPEPPSIKDRLRS